MRIGLFGPHLSPATPPGGTTVPPYIQLIQQLQNLLPDRETVLVEFSHFEDQASGVIASFASRLAPEIIQRTASMLTQLGQTASSSHNRLMAVIINGALDALREDIEGILSKQSSAVAGPTLVGSSAAETLSRMIAGSTRPNTVVRLLSDSLPPAPEEDLDIGPAFVELSPQATIPPPAEDPHDLVPEGDVFEVVAESPETHVFVKGTCLADPAGNLLVQSMMRFSEGRTATGPTTSPYFIQGPLVETNIILARVEVALSEKRAERLHRLCGQIALKLGEIEGLPAETFADVHQKRARQIEEIVAITSAHLTNEEVEEIVSSVKPDDEGFYSIGQGGVGKVYFAYDCTIKRIVVLKLLPLPEGIEPTEHHKRYANEIAFQGGSTGRGIATIHAAGTTGTGVPFYVMEVMWKGDLGKRIDTIDRQNTSFIEIHRHFFHLFIDAMKGVAAAHEQGVVHNDLKPQNIFITRNAEAQHEEAVVADFGLSERTHEEGETSISDRFYGTPGYMPPERCRGSKGNARSDVYALAAMLFEMYGGKLPAHVILEAEARKLKTPLTKGDLEDPQKLVMAAFSPAPLIRQIKPDLPEELAKIIDKGLRHDPNKRYATAGEMLRALLTFEAKAYERRLSKAYADRVIGLTQGEDLPEGTDIWEFAIAKQGPQDRWRMDLEHFQALLRHTLREYKLANASYPSPELNRQVKETTYRLFQVSDLLGDDEERARTAKGLLELDPDSLEAKRANRLIEVVFNTGDLPPNASITLYHYSYEGKLLTPDATPYHVYRSASELPDVLQLPRGGQYVAVLRAPGYRTSVVEIPVRPSEDPLSPHKKDLFMVAESRLPANHRWTIVPPGYGVVRTTPGSYAEIVAPEDLRSMEEVIAYGAPISIRQVMECIRKKWEETKGNDEKKRKAVASLIPGNWNTESLDLEQGQVRDHEGIVLDPELPVSHLSPEAGEEIFKILFPGSNIEYPLLTHHQRTGRPGEMLWPRGDRLPSDETAGAQQAHVATPLQALPLSVESPTANSIFIPPGETAQTAGAVHVFDNLRWPTRLPSGHENPKGRERIMAFLDRRQRTERGRRPQEGTTTIVDTVAGGFSRSRVARYAASFLRRQPSPETGIHEGIFAFGTPYTADVPLVPGEHIEAIRRGDYAEMGLRPVIRLGRRPLKDSVKALTGRDVRVA